MRLAWVSATVIWAALAVFAAAADQPGPAAPGRVQALSPDEQAVRRLVDAFATAYNAGDAAAVAALFTSGGEIVDETGRRVEGRPEIEKVFAAVFANRPQARIQMAIASLQFPAPTVALEDGVATVTDAQGQAVERMRYTAIHVKNDGQWLMASARDLRDEPAGSGVQLKQLEWLIGDWIDESPASLIVTSYRWADNHNYILSEFKVQAKGRAAMTGTQRIGWDPLVKQFRSWTFDSEGGFGEGRWTQEGRQWVVKVNAVTRDGKTASSTNITTQVSGDRMTWQSRDRVLDGKPLPDVEPIHVVRRPPQPR